MTDNKTYILQKDYNTIAHSYKAGTDIAFINGKYVVGLEIFTEEQVRSMPDWFKEKLNPVEDKRITVTQFIPHSCIDKDGGVIYTFYCNIAIPSEKYEAVKKAIERTLNHEITLDEVVQDYLEKDTTVSDIPTLNYQDKVREVKNDLGTDYFSSTGEKLCPWSSYENLFEQNQEILERMFVMLTYADIWEIIEGVNRLNIDDNNRGYLHHYFHSEWLKRTKLQLPVPDKQKFFPEDVIGCYFKFGSIAEGKIKEWIRMQEQQTVNTK